MAQDNPNHTGSIIILMGVSGSGKTTIGRALAQRLGCAFYEGDSFHLSSNIEKMSHGIPLTDEDRVPWLHLLNDHVKLQCEQNFSAVYSCSALKTSYREILLDGITNAYIVYLRGSFHLLKERLEHRTAHFMKPNMLESQFEDLEEPEDAFVVNSNQTIHDVVNNIVEKLKLYVES